MSTTPSIRETVPVTYFGVHWTSDGIAFLEQGGAKGGANALGLREKSPFRVQIQGPANHLIPLAAPNLNPEHIEVFRKLMACPLMQAMLPLPKGPNDPPAWFVEKADEDIQICMAALCRMSSPIRSPIMPIWRFKNARQIDEELNRTNVQPLVLTDCEVKHTTLIQQVVQLVASAPRRLIFVGHPTVPLPKGVKRLSSKDISSFDMDLSDLVMLPWEVEGAILVRRYMRGELNADG